MSIDLKKLENKLDEALSNETNETLTKFLTNKRMSNNKQSMKKLLIATLLIGMISSCEEPTTTTQSTEHSVKIGVSATQLRVVEIEGCEYFMGEYDRSALFAHKGNCKNSIHKGGNNEQQ